MHVAQRTSILSSITYKLHNRLQIILIIRQSAYTHSNADDKYRMNISEENKVVLCGMEKFTTAFPVHTYVHMYKQKNRYTN